MVPFPKSPHLEASFHVKNKLLGASVIITLQQKNIWNCWHQLAREYLLLYPQTLHNWEPSDMVISCWRFHKVVIGAWTMSECVNLHEAVTSWSRFSSPSPHKKVDGGYLFLENFQLQLMRKINLHVLSTPATPQPILLTSVSTWSSNSVQFAFSGMQEN